MILVGFRGPHIRSWSDLAMKLKMQRSEGCRAAHLFVMFVQVESCWCFGTCTFTVAVRPVKNNCYISVCHKKHIIIDDQFKFDKCINSLKVHYVTFWKELLPATQKIFLIALSIQKSVCLQWKSKNGIR